MNPKEILEALTCFHGTSSYYKHQLLPSVSIKLTDGCNYLREACKCYWLFDVIVSYQLEQSTEEFQVWKLTKLKGNEYKIIGEDGNNNVLITQIIPYSDFPLESITIWLVDGVAMIPSEY